ncbi:hypothetical protein [Sediminibacterium soli]|uniref:hypothetical protein n=1 Tax=Sediminibacterium soli TaxID=2698829 RepID=UPI001379F128|nr:hypothetical protein [Sediminibacterium soli]NCI45108.1 hypothetical protein [Sediminibacterium soli]
MSSRKLYTLKIYLTSICMVGILAWLTVSLPFVYKAQKVFHAKMAAAASASDQADDSNPLTNTTEEKTSSNTSMFSEEYLHDAHAAEHHFLTELSAEYKIEQVATYTAFYGELLSPPPDFV